MKLILTILLLFTAKCFSQTLQPPIPFLNDALVWTDGTIRIVSGDTVLLDKSGNSRNFKLTNVDFPITNSQLGIPFKTLCTVSAPVGDATLIAANSDSFFYANGLPVQLPVTDFFQCINYRYRIFCQTTTQVVDSTSKEVYIPRVQQIVWYNTAKTGTDSLRCIGYFGVPAENTTTMAWISQQGNDITGTGAKNTPYRSLDKIKATTKTIVYSTCGSYDMGILVTSTFSTTFTLQSTGRSTVWLANAGTNGAIISGAVSFKNWEIYDSSTTGFNVTGSSFGLDRCYIRNTKGNQFFNKNTASTTAISVTNCNIQSVNSNLLLTNVAGTFTYTFTGNYGIFKHNPGNAGTSMIFKYNKGTGSTSGANTFPFAAFTYKDNTNLQSINVTGITSRVVLQDEAINFTCIFDDSTYVNRCTITPPTNGQFKAKCDSFLNNTVTGSTTSAKLVDLVAKNNMLVQGNTITNTGVDGTNLFVNAAANSARTGVVVDSNTLSANVTSNYCLYVGETAQQAGVNAIQAAVIKRNKITNTNTGSAGTEAGHLAFLGGGNNHQFYLNNVITGNGYFMVIKNGGNSYGDTIPDVYSNVYEHTGSNNMLKGIYDRGADSVVFANNTILNWKSASNLFESDNNASGQANSLFVKNNLITLSANTSYSNGTVYSRYNAMNKNGFTATLTTADTSVTISYSSDGTPASRLNFGQALTGTGRNTQFATGYIVPSAILTRNQDASWQPGAVIIP
jgi:hypothetical protein